MRSYVFCYANTYFKDTVAHRYPVILVFHGCLLLQPTLQCTHTLPLFVFPAPFTHCGPVGGGGVHAWGSTWGGACLCGHLGTCAHALRDGVLVCMHKGPVRGECKGRACRGVEDLCPLSSQGHRPAPGLKLDNGKKGRKKDKASPLYTETSLVVEYQRLPGQVLCVRLGLINYILRL